VPLVLYCQYCGAAQQMEGTEIESQPKCQKCGSHKFQTEIPRQRRYLLTVNDRRFLRSLRIKADEEDFPPNLPATTPPPLDKPE
jgi:hypothetical protein